MGEEVNATSLNIEVRPVPITVIAADISNPRSVSRARSVSPTAPHFNAARILHRMLSHAVWRAMASVRLPAVRLPLNSSSVTITFAIALLVLVDFSFSAVGAANDANGGRVLLGDSFRVGFDSHPPTPRIHFSRMWWKHLEGSKVGAREVLAGKIGRGRCRKWLKDRMFVGAGEEPYSFIRYSAYRYNPSSFFVNALWSNTSGPIHGCTWLSAGGGRWEGSSFHHTSHHVGRDYHVVLVGCHFSPPAEDKEAGGFLLLDLGAGGSNSSLLVLHDLPSTCEREKSSKHQKNTSPTPNQKPEIAFCGPQIFSPGLNPKFLTEWFQYHRAITDHRSHFFVYMGIDPPPPLLDVVDKFSRLGVMTVEDTRAWNKFGTVFFGAQALFLHDCQHRGLQDFKWVINTDYDEYIYFTQPHASLLPFLEAHRQYPQVSFGSVIFAYIPCDEDDVTGNDDVTVGDDVIVDGDQPPNSGSDNGRWAVERMVYRQQGPDCQRKYNETDDANFCPPYRGRRKYAANPVTALGFGTPHNITEVEGFEDFVSCPKNESKVFVVSVGEVFLAHYRHFLTSEGFCTGTLESFKNSKKSLHQYPSSSRRFTKEWVKDVGVRNFVENLRKTRTLL